MMVDERLLGFAVAPGGRRYAAGPNGLRRSDDGGRSWRTAFEAEGVPATAVAAGTNGLAYAAVPGGIGRSDDGGETWRFVRLPAPVPLIATLAVADDGAVCAGTMQDGVLISEDGGKSWQGRNAGLFDLDVRAITFSPQFATDRAVFAATSTGLFRSENGARLWRPWGDLPGLEPLAALAVLPNGELLAAVEVLGLWRSREGGSLWTRIGQNVFSDEIEMIVTSTSDGLIWVSGEDRIFRSEDDGETWAEVEGLGD